MIDCAVIGTGISGTFAALYLKKFGISNIAMFDKSRGLGGRLATRRVEDGKFDHGAQYLNIEPVKLVPEIMKLIKNKIIFKWGDKEIYVSKDGMSNISKFLLSEMPTNREFKLIRIEETRSKIQLFFENGEVVDCKSVIFSSPIPQTIEIFNSSTVSIDPVVSDKLKTIEYDPCIVLLIESYGKTQLFNKYFGNEFVVGNIAWVADNHVKTISNRENFFTIFCSTDFSLMNLEKSYEEIAVLIKKDLKKIFPDGYKILSNHKWRYSIPNVFFEDALSINVGEKSFVGICGDAFANGRFDGAVRSGIDVASLYLDKYR